MDPGDPTSSANDLAVHHVLLPTTYLASNWPLTHAAVSANGLDIAVAGRQGLALYSRQTERWRLFGDVSQERRVNCLVLGWLDNIVVACSANSPEDVGGLPACPPAACPPAVAVPAGVQRGRRRAPGAPGRSRPRCACPSAGGRLTRRPLALPPPPPHRAGGQGQR